MEESTRSLRATVDQGVTFVELFFDLVFVFAVTQVVGLIAHEPTGPGVLRGLLVFWLVWWAWTQFTWSLNPANTDHPAIRVAVLAAMVVTFVMAFAIPDAYADSIGLRFVLPYVVVRLIGLGINLWVAWQEPRHRAAVRVFGVLSAIGLAVAVLGGIVDDPIRTWAWLVVIGADLFAARVAGRSTGWALHSGHFAERHGLFVIIALGESVIAVGVAAGESEWTTELALAILVGVAISCLLWWTYFRWAAEVIESGLARARHAAQAQLARDAYSISHFVLIFGVVAFAVGLEGAVAHPADTLPSFELTALIAGPALVVLATAAAVWRASQRFPTARVLVTFAALGAAARFGPELSALGTLVLIGAGIALLVGVEEWRHRTGARTPWLPIEAVSSDTGR